MLFTGNEKMQFWSWYVSLYIYSYEIVNYDVKSWFKNKNQQKIFKKFNELGKRSKIL